MKRIIVFGATGLLGRKIVDESLRSGHKVSLYVRSKEFTRDDTSIHHGDIADEAKVAEAIEGADVVVSAVGNRNYEDPTPVVTPFVKLIARRIDRAQRFIVVAGSGLTLADFRTLRRDLPGQPDFLKNQRADHWEAYCSLAPLDIDYLVVCPTMMVEGDADDHYTVGTTYFPKDAARQVFAGNVARFIATEISEVRYRQARVGIANKLPA